MSETRKGQARTDTEDSNDSCDRDGCAVGKRDDVRTRRLQPRSVTPEHIVALKPLTIRSKSMTGALELTLGHNVNPVQYLY